MPDSISVFQQILESHNKGHRQMAVFDLDSTLFNVTLRTRMILKDLAKKESLLEKYPNETPQLETMEILDSDWGIREALIRSGISAPLQFFSEVRDSWMKHFFSSDYLLHDEPYDGAVEFVNSLYKAGVDIRYLTGRDRERMGDGSIAALNDKGFPLDDPENHLILKPVLKLNDANYKKNAFDDIGHPINHIWFFENEPVIIHLVKEHFPDLNIIFIDTIHSGKAEAPEGLPVIAGKYATK
jgi:hypothetical protein